MQTKALYDQVANTYDELYVDDLCIKEDVSIARAISNILRGNVLDVWCWTGYIHKNVDLMGHEYLWIDISDWMIEIAKRNYPLQSFLAKDFMDLEESTKYSTVISTFCAGSYVWASKFMEKIEKLITDDGLFFVMLYGPDGWYQSYHTQEFKEWIEIIEPLDMIERFVDGKGYYLSIMSENGEIYKRATKWCSGSNTDKKIKYYILTNYDLFMPKEILNFIRQSKWTFAKTYAEKAPHSYLLEQKAKNIKLYKELYGYIKNNGYKEYFYRTPFIYMRVARYKYRGMADSESSIINRAGVETLYK